MHKRFSYSVLNCVLAVFLLALLSCNHVAKDHPAYFDPVISRSVELRDDGNIQTSIRYVDSVYAAFPHPGPGDMFKKHKDRFDCYFYEANDPSTALLYADSMMFCLAGHETDSQYVGLHITAILRKGDTYSSLRNYTESYRYYFEAKKLAQQVNNPTLLREFYTRIGLIYYKLKFYSDAANYMKEALYPLSDSLLRYSQPVFSKRQSLLDNIGLAYERSGNDDSALVYYNKALTCVENFRGNGENRKMYVEPAKAVIYGNMSGPVYRLGNAAKAEELLKQSISVNILPGYEARDAQTALLKLAKIYLETNRVDEVPPVLVQLRKLLDTLPVVERDLEWLELNARYYEQKKDPERAFYFAKKLISLNSENDKEVNSQSIRNLNNEFKTIESENEISVLKKRDKLNLLFLFLACCTAIMAIVIAVLIWRYWKRSGKTVSLLTTLNNQINTQNGQLERSIKLLDVSQTLGKTAGWEYNLKTKEIFLTRQAYLLYDLSNSFVPTWEGFRNLFNDEEKRILSAIALSTIKRKEQLRLETEIITEKNERKWVRIIAEPVLEDHAIVGSIGAIQDITLEKQAEKIQEDLTTHLQTLITSLEDIILELDGNKVFKNVWVSDEKELFMPKSMIIGKTIKESFGPMAELFANPIDEVLKTGATVEIEYRHLNPTINKWYKAKTTLIHKVNDLSQCRIIVSVQDITTRTLQDMALKEAKEKLERSNFLLDVSQELGKIGGWEYDFVTNDIFMTKQAYLIYGVGNDFVPTQENTQAFFDEESRKKLGQAAEVAARQLKPYDVELRLIAQDSTRKWIRSIGVPVIKNNNVVGMKGAIVDITAEKEAALNLIAVKENLERSNVLLDSSQELSQTGGWEYNLLTGEFFWSKQTYLIYGVSENFNPQLDAYLNLYSTPERDLLAQQIKMAIEKQLPFDLELRYKSNGGAEIWHMERGVPVIRDNKVVLLRGTVMDISTSKIAEQQLRSAKLYLEQSNEDKDRIMQVLVHDLRSPLSGINSVSSMMLKKTSYSASDKEMLSVINDTSLFLFKMVNDLVGFSLNNENKMIKREESDLKLLAQQTIQVLQFRAEEKKQRIELEAKNDIYALIDDQKIQRVLNNIITNALKFSASNTTTTVGIKEEGSVLRISVRDEGIGIPLELKDKVFDVFTEAKRYGTNNEQPFGLGLSICKQIVEAHDGKIWFESELGKGTTFFIEIPDCIVRIISRLS